MQSGTYSENDAAGARQERFSAACRILEEAIRRHAFPGCAFGVLAAHPGGDLRFTGARGRFTYNEDAAAVTPETVFDLASLTKVAATTAMAMLLHQRGQLDLAAPLGELLPEFVAGRAAGDPARRATLAHLLAHSSGLPGYVEFFRSLSTPEALLEACCRLPLEAEPGARAEYSDPGFILLGRVLQTITGESLDHWAQREIFQPLGMTATTFKPPPGARSSIPPTERDTTLRHRTIQGEVQDENAWLLGGVAGHAGLFSNAGDLLLFAGEVIAAAAGRGQARLLDTTTVELFARRQPPAGSSRALGWDTPSENSSSGQYFSLRSIGHLGYSGCSLWIDLEAEIAVVLLSNRTWPDRRSQEIRLVRPAFHDAIRTDPETVLPVHASLPENSGRN
ncbi:MAG: serine hydrolase domain-containing protein [Terracidiphilus sp.]